MSTYGARQKLQGQASDHVILVLRGEHVLITVRGFVGEQLIFAATSKLWRYIAERETETTSDWVLDPTQANAHREANFLGRKMGGCLPGGRVRRCGSRLWGVA
jgi:hypothetical protein